MAFNDSLSDMLARIKNAHQAKKVSTLCLRSKLNMNVLSVLKDEGYIRDFKNIVGKNGSFQDNFKVYNRENKSCLSPGCKGTIKKKFITNRSTFFCNICQK